MKKFFFVPKILFILLLIIFVSGCGSSGGSGRAIKWVFLVYMDGDNNLNSAALSDLEEMKAVGSTDKVKIIVQHDSLSPTTEEKSFTGTRRYLVKKNELELLQELDEQDMANPSVLTSFINWAVNQYQADHYILVLWNHGGGWKKTKDYPPFKGIIHDETNNSWMSLTELSTALANSGKIFDIIGTDACLMAELEVAYQIKDYANYLVASEESEPASGWPYIPILTALTNNPGMTPLQLCQQIVNDYIANTLPGPTGITMSAIQLNKINELAEAVNQFGTALATTSDTSLVYNAKIFAQRYSGYTSLADLYHFAQLISGTSAPRDSNLVAKANLVKNKLSQAVVANNKSGLAVANSYGLTIYLPYLPSYYESDYNSILFAQNFTEWKNFLLRVL